MMAAAVSGAAFDPALNLIPNGTFTDASNVTLNNVGGNTPTISGGLLHLNGRGSASETLLQSTVADGTYSISFDVGPNQDDYPVVTVGGVNLDFVGATVTGTTIQHVVMTFTATAASTAFVCAGNLAEDIDIDNLVLNRIA